MKTAKTVMKKIGKRELMHKEKMLKKLEELKQLVKLDDNFYTPVDENRIVRLVDDVANEIAKLYEENCH